MGSAEECGGVRVSGMWGTGWRDVGCFQAEDGIQVLVMTGIGRCDLRDRLTQFGGQVDADRRSGGRGKRVGLGGRGSNKKKIWGPGAAQVGVRCIGLRRTTCGGTLATYPAPASSYHSSALSHVAPLS